MVPRLPFGRPGALAGGGGGLKKLVIDCRPAAFASASVKRLAGGICTHNAAGARGEADKATPTSFCRPRVG